MIGNDIVDLQLARKESNWRRAGFAGKLFTVAEQAAIAAAADPVVCLWVMWSMKEAAYKIYNRETGVRAFNPHWFDCALHHLTDKNARGLVRCRLECYLTQTVIKDEIIHTVAVRPSDAGREITCLQDGLIRKDTHGHPFIHTIEGVTMPVSRSHHGRCSVTVGFSGRE